MSRYFFSLEERYLNHLIIHSNDNPASIGLLNGQMGIALTLLHYSRVKNIKTIECCFDFLLNNILDNITKETIFNFGDGLAGIGWGIEYLIQNHYMKGESIDICQEIDYKLLTIDIDRLEDNSLYTGLEGLFTYVIAHIQGGLNSNRQVFDRAYILKWKSLIEYKLDQAKDFEKFYWQHKYDLFNSIVNGKQICELTLLPFVKTCNKPSLENLGLQDGVSGFLELSLY